MPAASPPNPEILRLLGYVFGVGFAFGILLIALGISAKILQAACRIVGEPAPETGRAMITSLIESIAGGLIGFSGAVGIAVVHAGGLTDGTTTVALVRGLQVTTGIFVPAAIYVPMLNLSFKRGLAVSVVRVLITAAILVTLVLGFAVATGRIKV